MSTLERALEIAVQAHRGQRQKNNLPYILHPLHLFHQMQSVEEKIVALLHDAVEDSDLTIADLRTAGFSDPVITAIELLTHSPEEIYTDYIDRICKNNLARTIKLADLRHNMDITRLESLTDSDVKRLRKYHAAWIKLSEHPISTD